MRTALDVHRQLLARDVRHEIVRLQTQVAGADDLPTVMDLSDGCAAVRCFRLAGGPLVAVLVRAGTSPEPAAVLAALRAAGLAAPPAPTDADPDDADPDDADPDDADPDDADPEDASPDDARGEAEERGTEPPLRPATAAEINAGTDFAAGLVSPVGLPPDVPLLVDARLAARHVLYVAAGEGGVALGIRTRDLLAVTGARVAALTGPDAAGRGAVVVLPGPGDAGGQRSRGGLPEVAHDGASPGPAVLDLNARSRPPAPRRR